MMKKSDWVTLRLLRKMVRQNHRAMLDNDVRKAVLYLNKKYGKKHFIECCDALDREEAEKQAEYLFTPTEPLSKFVPPKSLSLAKQWRKEARA